MSPSLRGWQVHLANAAKSCLAQMEGAELTPRWRPAAEPYWPATISPPVAIIAPGGAGGAWVDPEEELTLCGVVPAFYSVVVVAGTPSRKAEELLPMMVEAVWAHLSTEVMAIEEAASSLWGAPSIGTIGAPQEIPGAATPNAPTFLGAPIEVVLRIPQPSPTPG